MSRKWLSSWCWLIGLLFGLPAVVIGLLALGRRWYAPHLIPQQLDWLAISHYWQQDATIGAAVKASLSLGLGTVVLTLLLAYPVAIAFVRYHSAWQGILNILIYAPLIIPGIALTTSLDLTFIQLHLTGTWLGVVIVQTLFCLPYAIKLLVDNLAIYQVDYVAVATNLRASRWQTFWHVTLPLSRDGLIGAVTMTLIVAMSQYLTTLLIGDGNYLTLAINMFPLIQGGRYQAAACYGVIFMLTLLVPLGLFELLLKLKVRRLAHHEL